MTIYILIVRPETLDFKHNLEKKQKIVARVEELERSGCKKAFRELQDLHRIWKEDIGPVSKNIVMRSGTNLVI
jgi:Na+-translocating ferredoxin:NAD+ oxidoreductase RNF subunit RnfB